MPQLLLMDFVRYTFAYLMATLYNNQNCTKFRYVLNNVSLQGSSEFQRQISENIFILALKRGRLASLNLIWEYIPFPIGYLYSSFSGKKYEEHDSIIQNFNFESL